MAEAAPVRDRPECLGEAMSRVARAFSGVSDTAQLDARLLLQHASGCSLEELVAEPRRALDEDASERLERYVARRLAGEPVARILGFKEFWGRDFALSEQTLVPRPDSELLVEAGLACLKETDAPAPVIVDLGTGSGCLLVSLLAECPHARGLGVDLSAEALGAARSNAVRQGVADRASFVRGNWLEAVAVGAADLIVANPPYIPAGEIAGLAREVAAWDPRLALDGGEDGFEAVRIIARQAREWLKPGGALLMEIGAGQAEQARELVRAGGLDCGAGSERLHDLAGTERVIRGVRRVDPA